MIKLKSNGSSFQCIEKQQILNLKNNPSSLGKTINIEVPSGCKLLKKTPTTIKHKNLDTFSVSNIKKEYCFLSTMFLSQLPKSNAKTENSQNLNETLHAKKSAISTEEKLSKLTTIKKDTITIQLIHQLEVIYHLKFIWRNLYLLELLLIIQVLCLMAL